jgi:Luciferase-like monooxygenase
VRFGLTVPNFGDYFDPRLLATLARDAEQAGWGGFFVWDHTVAWPTPIVDPWVALSAIAIATEKIRIGPLVTPLPRRRPTKLVQRYVDAGVTWWLEDVSPWAFGWQWAGPWPVDQMNDRIRAGPPRLLSSD